ncbi:PQQ-binding-like beta-propeller repeat protein [Actinoplanes sp. NPDC049802]|uniref:outer membrane protein assembly factor BamB family protein n=1 Tax=Actinoplanes sp. NPDC049802 TaxID=3154742 RepID=UPI0033E816E5
MRTTPGPLGLILTAVIAATGGSPAAVASPPPPTADWVQDGHDATHDNFNPSEYRITAATVGRLAQGWSVTTTQRRDGACSRQTPPVVVGSRLVLTDPGGVGAYDATTGRTLWTHRLTNPADQFPPQLAADRSSVYLFLTPCRPPASAPPGTGGAGQSGELVALDIASGTVRWRTTVPTAAGNLLLSHGVALVGGSDGTDMGTWAFDTATGRARWHRLGVITQQCAADTTILLSRPYRGGTLAADISTGHTLWQTPREWLCHAADPAARHLIISETDRDTPAQPGQNPPMRLLKVRADTGATVWARDALMGPVAVDHDQVYAAATKNAGQTLVAVDLDSGETRWHRHLGSVLPSIAGGLLWGNFGAPTGEQKLRALEPDTGADLALPSAVSAAAGLGTPVISHGRLYLTNGTDTLRAFTMPATADPTGAS